MSKVMLLGLGRVGWQVLEYLVQDPKCPELVFCDIQEEGRAMVDNAVIGAGVFDLYPSVKFYQLDVMDIDATADLIREEKPDVIVDMSVVMPMHGFYKLPKEQFDKIYSAKFGAWLPCQVALPYRLSLAIKKSGVKTHLITSGIPDLVNPALAKVGLAPTVGMGNVNLIVAAARVLVSRRMNVPMDCVRIYLVAHHAWVVYPRDDAYQKTPYFLKVMINDRDVTSQFDTDQLLWDAMKLYPPAPSTVFYTLSAKSIIKNMYALLSPSPVFTHAPGPKGLMGGYPITISKNGVELALPEGITESEAIKINEDATRISEGFDRIEEDGTCVWADYAYEAFHELLGWERKSFKVEESYEVALELRERYKKFEAKYC